MPRFHFVHTAAHTVPYTAPVTPGSRGDWAYGELKRGLITGEFAVNVPLREERLGEVLAVSRTPIREALKRLYAEGLVERGPDGRYRPVAPDVEVMLHLYEVRAGLEKQGLRRPASRRQSHDRELLLALRRQWEDLARADLGASPDFVLLDESFHVTLAEAAGNPLLAALLRQVNERIRIVRMQDFLTRERLSQTVEEHLCLLEAVLAGEIEEAVMRFESHLARSLEVVEERTARALARMVDGGEW